MEKEYFDFIEQKADKKRDNPIKKEIGDILFEYIQGKHDREVLMPSHKGDNQPLNYRQMQKLIVKYGLELEKLIIHSKK